MADKTTEKTESADNTEAKEEAVVIETPVEEVKEETKEETATEEAPAKEATEETVEETVVEEVKDPEVDVRPGYTVKLHLRINDGKKERIQIFEGIVLKMSGATPETRTITVRKVSKGFGIEKIVPLSMPTLEKVEVVKIAKVRRASLGYVRKHKKRLKERQVS